VSSIFRYRNGRTDRGIVDARMRRPLGPVGRHHQLHPPRFRNVSGMGTVIVSLSAVPRQRPLPGSGGME
jgi:hypothetical protein